MQIVLVHGALTDASVWDPVLALLLKEGHDVIAPAMPLRGLASDAAYLSAFLAGPSVVVGHSWAGQVLAQLATPAARALVFVAAFIPAEGEAAGELNARLPGSLLGPDTLRVRDAPGGPELYLAPERFAEVYAADLPAAANLARRQRPIVPSALEEKLAGQPSWRSAPSWAVVTTQDRSIPHAAQRFMAERAGAHIVEADASHAVPLSRPDVVAKAIVAALHGKE